MAGGNYGSRPYQQLPAPFGLPDVPVGQGGPLPAPYDLQSLMGSQAPPPMAQELPMEQPRYTLPDTFSAMSPEEPQVPQSTPTPAMADSAPSQERWSATGKTDTFGSFFNKPQATDAFTAFGAAMLKAPSFLEGLGDAALAVNAVDRENRMPTSEEIAKANIKARIASGKGVYAPKPLANGFDAQGNFWTGTFVDGAEVWSGPEGKVQPYAPDGFTPSSQSGVLQNRKDVQKYRDEAKVGSDLAQQNINSFDKILELAPTTGVGSGVIETTIRGVASTLGKDLGGVDLSDSQVLLKELRALELKQAQTQRGLGQLTEMERQIIREGLPSISTELQSILEVSVAMKLAAQFDIELYDDYMTMPESRRPNFEEYSYLKRKEQKASRPERIKVLLENEIAKNPAYKAPSNTKSPSSPQSILDEADAIVN